MSASSSTSPATRLDFKDVSVSILIDDKPVEMYKPEINGNKISCFIESAEGKEFKVQGMMTKSFSPYNMSFFTNVDGTRMGGVFSRQPGVGSIFDGPYTSGTTIQPLVFAKIKLTDDSTIACTDEQYVKNLGTIQVQCLRGQEYGVLHASGAELQGFSNDRSVNEQSKKANVSHQVGLGAAKVVPQLSTVHVHYLDSRETPYALFEIKYRSRALLELDDIVKPLIPVNNEPSASTSSASTSTASTSAQTNKKRKTPPSSNYKTDKDGAIVISDDSDDEVSVKKEGKKVKKEKESKPKIKGEKVWIEID